MDFSGSEKISILPQGKNIDKKQAVCKNLIGAY